MPRAQEGPPFRIPEILSRMSSSCVHMCFGIAPCSTCSHLQTNAAPHNLLRWIRRQHETLLLSLGLLFENQQHCCCYVMMMMMRMTLECSLYVNKENRKGQLGAYPIPAVQVKCCNFHDKSHRQARYSLLLLFTHVLSAALAYIYASTTASCCHAACFVYSSSYCCCCCRVASCCCCCLCGGCCSATA